MIIFQRRLQEKRMIKGILQARIGKEHREIPRDESRDRIAELTTTPTMAQTLMLPTMEDHMHAMNGRTNDELRIMAERPEAERTVDIFIAMHKIEHP